MSFSCVSEVMSKNVITLQEQNTLAQAVRVFEQSKISGAPVIDAAGKYVGVLSKTDMVSQRLMGLLTDRGGFDHITVGELMSAKAPLSVKESDPLDNAIELMDKHQIHRIFVTDGHEKITGIITTLDVVSRLRYSFESYL